MSADSESRRVLVQMEMLEAGIAPVCPKSSMNVMFFPHSLQSMSHIESVIDEVRRFMSSLTPEEQRKAKRKFRKLWRRALSESIRKTKGSNSSRIASSLTRSVTTMVTESNGKRHPDNRAQHHRIHSVYRMFLEKVAYPSE